MNLRFISPAFHGIIDYIAAVALIVAPFMLGLGDSSILALWISVTTGLIVILVSTNTIYKYGIFQTLSFNAHL